MEQENIGDVSSREEACKKVKQIAEVIKKLKINNYLKLGGMSEKDRQAIELLEENMETVGKENGLQQLVSELKKKMAIRYDIIGENTADIENGETTNDNTNTKIDKNDVLEKYRGAIDAGKEALGTGKISKARRCQIQADKYMQRLGEFDRKRATEYKRELFFGLSETKDRINEGIQKWQQIYKDCLKPDDYEERKEIADEIKQMMKGRENVDETKYAESNDRS